MPSTLWVEGLKARLAVTGFAGPRLLPTAVAELTGATQLPDGLVRAVARSAGDEALEDDDSLFHLYPLIEVVAAAAVTAAWRRAARRRHA
ncbi:hypothetical protein [Streptomyces sp. 1222.5]|uniref:hypothetical protein n=1 Tax=Streptomyces sp. 1222.5 TaxID=1881026 RepID=UPI003EBF5E13